MNNYKTGILRNNVPRGLVFAGMACLLMVLPGCMMPKELKTGQAQALALIESGKFESGIFVSGNHPSAISTLDAPFRLHYVTNQRVVIESLKGTQEADTASAGKPWLVFLHGTPGDWTIFGPQLGDASLQNYAQIVALDRPGWGGSDKDPSQQSTSLKRQADIIAPFLTLLKKQQQPVILVGHSLGATLAPRIAMTYPNLVDAVVVIAGDLTEVYYRKSWYNDMANWGWMNTLLPYSLAYANDEVMALKGNLSDMDQLWPTMKVPMWVVQGGKDQLVDPKNVKFAQSVKTRSTVEVIYDAQGGHLLHMQKPILVNELLANIIAASTSKEESETKPVM